MFGGREYDNDILLKSRIVAKKLLFCFFVFDFDARRKYQRLTPMRAREKV